MEYNQPKELNILHNVAKDIIEIRFKESDTLGNVNYKFYEIMRKYNIKQGARTDSGICTNNYEWTICLDLFISQIISYLNWDGTVGIPKDLEAY